jgi:hypothetical protein
MDPLFVVLGAGASHACTSEQLYPGIIDEHPQRPPLVTGLFHASQTQHVLARYPQAQAAAAAIRRAGSEALAIEEWIREHYRDSDYEGDRRKFVSITYYLQELLLEASNNFKDQPDNYDLLIRDLLQAQERVVFVSLNYDLLLDRRLSIEGPQIGGFQHYIRREGEGRGPLSSSMDR